MGLLKGFREIDFPLTGSLDQITAATKVKREDFLEISNFRLSRDGTRIEKRLGLVEEVTTELGSVDVFGYTTYYNATPVFCELAVTEAAIWRKITGGSWTSIHTLASTLAHPVRPLEIQGKQFVITEVDSRMIHTDGNDYQIGITAPATLPTLSAGTGGQMFAGVYRYAVTYIRSGNYGNESDPKYSSLSAVSFTGGGLNDMTVSGTYTGAENISVKVLVDSASDTISISYDGGTNYSVTGLKIQTTVYAAYGITLTFAAATGHTNTNYWTFTASAGAVTIPEGTKSIAAVTFVGSGLNDCTSSGTYVGDEDLDVHVAVESAGTTDTVRVSYDGGETWDLIGLAMKTTAMVLREGITVTFAAITGHTVGDYWHFAVAGGNNGKVTLTSIPVSSDAQVTGRKIYRTTQDGAKFYWLTTISDNTTTTFVDNTSDTLLGDEVELGHEVLPNGKFAAWWDNRLWVSGDNIVYYSEIDNPEQFDATYRYVKIRDGKQGDEITQLVEYKDNLYVFKRYSVHIIQRKTTGYGQAQCSRDVGCIAPWSLISLGNLLMFLSYKGWEVYNGCEVYSLGFSDRLVRSLAKVDKTKADLISSVHNQDRNEAWLSIPDPTSGSAFTCVYNYVRNAFYEFSFYKTPSCLVECRNSSKLPVVKMGTRDGYVDLCESGYVDGATAITASFRKGWYETDNNAQIRKFEVEAELPASKTLTATFYTDVDKDAARTDTYTGSTPSATDIELRRPITDFSELGLRGIWSSFKISNAENVGGELKVNRCTLYLAERKKQGGVAGD